MQPNASPSSIRAFVLLAGFLAATAGIRAAGDRERLSLDFGWRFALGHATDHGKDFDPATGAFSYFAKAGYGSGAAAAGFSDAGWRAVNLPHDWAVELPFDRRGSASHGSKAIGRNFPEHSVGWYRKTFTIPASDLGRRIQVEFDGVFRDSIVWINGHYLGTEESGYLGFAYNLTEYLNYGGENTLAVRVDASLEEGWFYEGGGIYRHVWLVKTAPLHVAREGTVVTTELQGGRARVAARTTVRNEGTEAVSFQLSQSILDADGQTLASTDLENLELAAGDSREWPVELGLTEPKLWSIEAPYLHRLVTVLRASGREVDRYETPFGVRTLRFDPNEGFFLNGRQAKLQGANNHQDHAGVGIALPDGLQEYRIAQLKQYGVNAYRCSHHPPTPELLDACDRLGMVVIDEHRLMGVSDFHYDQLGRMIRRDRNHPSVIVWSVGNEEWAIEGNEKGARITAAMQAFARRLDPTRPSTVATSGGWDGGSSAVSEIMGYNYKSHGSIDQHHAKFPQQPSLLTEECALFLTRGVYADDRPQAHLSAYDRKPSDWGCSAEDGWNFCATRPYLAGLFLWTGFDYRGEPTPFGWPAIGSQFGILDTCGFPKDVAFYFKAWWTDQPVVHLMPHWNWTQQDQEIDVWCYANADEVELSLNGEILGRKPMKPRSHLEWKVKFEPGVLLARGFKDGKEIARDQVETTGEPRAVRLSPHRAWLRADAEDVAVITVDLCDAEGRRIPTATNPIEFALTGPGRILGVGNGDPSSHEPDTYVETISSLPLTPWRSRTLASPPTREELSPDFDDSQWPLAFGGRGRGGRNGAGGSPEQTNVFRAAFEWPAAASGSAELVLARTLGAGQSIYLNGKRIAPDLPSRDVGQVVPLPQPSPGRNVIAVVAVEIAGGRGGRGPGARGGALASIRVTVPPVGWERSLFGGLALIIVQSTREPGEIELTARCAGLEPAVLRTPTHAAQARLFVP